MVMVDISRAPLQSQHLALSDRYIASPPPCLDLKGTSRGGSFSSEIWPVGRYPWIYLEKAFVCLQMRTFKMVLTISSVMRGAGYYQHRLDMCVFSKRSNGPNNVGEISAVLIIHVGEVLMRGPDDEFRFSPQTIQQFETGAIDSLKIVEKFLFWRI